MYGREINSPTTSITRSPAVSGARDEAPRARFIATSGNAISSAVRNWLETSPRT